MSQWLAVSLTVYMTVSFVTAGLRKGRLQESLQIIRRIRVPMILQNLCVLALVIAVGYGLYQLPVLDWGWWKLLHGSAGSGGRGGNFVVVGFSFKYFAVIYFLLFVLAVPQLAKSEEKSFREGTRDWGHAVPRSLGFGLLHCVVGIPLSYGLALSIAGLWFTHQYFRGGVRRSTVYHACWNLMLLTILAAALLAS